MAQKMRAAVQSVVVEFRMLARPLEILSSPQAIATQGTIAFVNAMIANEPNRVLQPSPRSGRPITLTITARAISPDSERMSSNTVGLMSWTATLIRRNEAPQISARPISARYGFTLNTRWPLVRRKNERHRAVVFDAHPHVSSKAAGLSLYSALAEPLDEHPIKLLRTLRIAGLEQARPPAAAHVGEQGELRNDQRRPAHVDQAEVHPARLIREHAQVDDLVRQASHGGFVVIGCRTHQQHISVSDGCTLLGTCLVPAHRACADALSDDPQMFGPKCGSAWMSESM